MHCMLYTTTNTYIHNTLCLYNNVQTSPLKINDNSLHCIKILYTRFSYYTHTQLHDTYNIGLVGKEKIIC